MEKQSDQSGRRRFVASSLATVGTGTWLSPASAASEASAASAASAQAADALHAEVQAVLDRFNTLISTKDLAILAEFTDDAVMVGSESGEIAEGKAAISAFLRHAFAKPSTVSWDWHTLRARRVGDLAWFFVDSDVLVTGAGQPERLPYRVSGVLQKQGTRWLWRQYHGAEPAGR